MGTGNIVVAGTFTVSNNQLLHKPDLQMLLRKFGFKIGDKGTGLLKKLYRW